MKIIDPKVEIITETNPLKRIEKCGRVCYKSEDKITADSARKFVEMLVSRGHTSALEHARVKVSQSVCCRLVTSEAPEKFPYGFKDRLEYADEKHTELLMNARDFLAIGGTLDELETFENAPDYLTVLFTCDRAIANELVRHRVFSFSQESTRYVNYKDGIEFIRPLPFEWANFTGSSKKFVGGCDMNTSNKIAKYGMWYDTCYQAERNYIRMIQDGCKPQEARNVLPLSTKTELVMTGTFSQWTEMLKLRLDKAAHPQMQYLMKLLVENELFPKGKIAIPEVAK